MMDILPRKLSVALVAGLTCALLTTAVAAGGLAITDAWGWGTNVGWISLGAAPDGVKVCTDHLEGYAWGENVGWIRMGTATGCGSHQYPNTSNTDYGVNVTDSGNLDGYAWGTNVGWIRFSPTDGNVRLDSSTGKLSGFAWGENAGWIRFDAQYGTTDPPAATSTPPSATPTTPAPAPTVTNAPPSATPTIPASAPTATRTPPLPTEKVYLPSVLRFAPGNGQG